MWVIRPHRSCHMGSAIGIQLESDMSLSRVTGRSTSPITLHPREAFRGSAWARCASELLFTIVTTANSPQGTALVDSGEPFLDAREPTVEYVSVPTACSEIP